MNRPRRKCDPQSGLTGSSKPNRLSRSFRQTQQTQKAAEGDSPRSQRSDFKTPTRIRRSRAGGGFSGESPHNDSDIQQDIIWDATSPSPNRLGKRGKKQPAGVVDISEIVSRIAPKYGRPKVVEPTLQQWIGDSAAIPCTPDVQAPKPKKKSPRPNGVDDLLKLAKQFDLNMFRRDEEEEEEVEEEEEDLHQQSLELLAEDVLDLENGDRSDFSPSPPGSCPPAVKADVQMSQHMEDDLDLLFDGPTQHVSGNLSQVSSAQPSQVKPASGASSKEASGKPCSPSPGVSSTNTKGTLAHSEFEDDWDNDDLLNDSLVLEMTQNPQSFTAPRLCSTQKPPSEIKHHSPVNVPVSRGVGIIQSAASKVDHVRQRTTFKLESNHNFSFKRIQTSAWTNSKDSGSEAAEEAAQRDRFSSTEGVLVKAGSERTGRASNSVKSEPQKPEFYQRTSVVDSNPKFKMTASTASNTSAPKTTQSAPQRPSVVSSCHEAPAVVDLLDDDLDSFFSSDPVWDDPADDDLLCEMCEDVENQIQSAENVSTELPMSKPSNRTWDSRHQPANQHPYPQKQTPSPLPCDSGRPAVSSSAAGFVSNISAGVQVDTRTDSFRFTQSRNSSGSTNRWTCVQGSSRVQSAPQGNAHRDQFTFKKPNNPAPPVTNKVVGKCSAAEIELKKQQAMERRRQRLQATQNLRAPT